MKNSLEVIRVNNPLDRADQTRELVPMVLGTTTLADVVSQAAGNLPAIRNTELAVSMNGIVYPREQWGQIMVLPEQQVIIIPVMYGGGDGAKDVLRAVAMIVVAVVATIVSIYVPAMWGITSKLWAGVVGGLLAGGVMMAGATLVNALIPYSAPQPPALNGSSSISDSNSYSWSPQTTQQQGTVIPWALGRCLLTGNIISTTRESIGDKQYLNILIHVGEGPLADISSIKINDQAVSNYSGLQVETRLGLLNQEPIPFFNDTKREYPLGLKTVHGTPVLYTTVENDFAGIEVELTFNGIYHMDDYGNLLSHSIDYSVEISPAGTNSWQPITTAAASTSNVSYNGRWSAGQWLWSGNVFTGSLAWTEIEAGSTYNGDHIDGETYTGSKSAGNSIPVIWRWLDAVISLSTSVTNRITATAAQRSVVRHTWRADNLAAGYYDVRVTKWSDDIDDVRYGDEMYLTAVRCVDYDDFEYPCSALVGIRGLATDTLSGSFSFSCETSGKLVRVYRGGQWHTEAAQSPAWHANHILTMPIFDNYGGPVKYLGLNQSAINLIHWQELADYNADQVLNGKGGTEDRLTWNGQFDTLQTMWDAALSVLSAGRATPYWRGNIVCLAIDKPVSEPSYILSVGNVLKDSFKESWLPMSDRAKTIEADFLNLSKSLQRDKLTVVNHAAPSHWGTAKLPMQGCIYESEVIRRSLYHLNTTLYTTRSASITCDVDALPVTMGSVIALQHDVLMVGEGGRISSATANTITLDHLITIDPDQTYMIDLVTANGMLSLTMVGHDTVTLPNGNTATRITVDQPMDPVPGTYTVYAFGPPDKRTKWWRVCGIRPAGDLRQEFALAEYNASMYESDYGQPVLPTPTNSSAQFPVISDLAATEAAPITEGGVLQRTIIVSWTAEPAVLLDHAEIYARVVGLPWQMCGTSSTNSFTIPARPNEQYEVMVLAVDRVGNKTRYSQAQTAAITTSSTSGAIANISTVAITGLQVVGGGDTFNTRDCQFVWDAPVLPGTIDHYQIDIYVGQTPRRSETSHVPAYTYTYGRNIDDGSGTPVATFTVRVQAVDIGGTASTAVALTVSNSAPAIPTAMTGTGELMSNRLTLSYPLPDDFAGVEIWSHTSNDRTAASLIGTTKTTSFLHTGLPAASSRYYWIRVADVYDQYSPWYPSGSGINVVSLADPSDIIRMLDDQVDNDKIASYLTGNTGLLDILDNFQMVFENGIVGPGIVARYTDAIGQNSSDLVLVKNQITSLLTAVNDLITGEWDSSINYSIGQIVRYQNETYRSIAPSTNILPTDTAYWQPVSGIIDLINEIQSNLDTATATWTQTATSVNARLDTVEPIVTGHTSTIRQNADAIELASTALVGPLIAYQNEVFEKGVQVETPADLRDLDVRITNTKFRMDTAEGNIVLAASRIDAAENRLALAEIDIDGANAAIALKAAQSTVDGLTGVVNAKAAQIDLDAANQMIGLKLSKTGTDGAGMAIAYNSATGKYNTTFLTDTFSIAQPSGAGPVNTFMVGNVNGSPQVGINGGLVVDGTIQARSIAANQLIVGDNVAMGANAYIGWSNVTSKPNIPDANYITSITQNTITTAYVNALNVTASAVNVSYLSAITANLGTVTGSIVVSDTTTTNETLQLGYSNTTNAFYNTCVDGRHSARMIQSVDLLPDVVSKDGYWTVLTPEGVQWWRCKKTYAQIKTMTITAKMKGLLVRPSDTDDLMYAAPSGVWKKISMVAA